MAIVSYQAQGLNSLIDRQVSNSVLYAEQQLAWAEDQIKSFNPELARGVVSAVISIFKKEMRGFENTHFFQLRKVLNRADYLSSSCNKVIELSRIPLLSNEFSKNRNGFTQLLKSTDPMRSNNECLYRYPHYNGSVLLMRRLLTTH